VKARLYLQGAFQPCTEFLARDFYEAELVEVRVVELRVEQHETPVDEARR
jgi:hypothetical protein